MTENEKSLLECAINLLNFSMNIFHQLGFEIGKIEINKPNKEQEEK